jgi:hypothetical protein
MLIYRSIDASKEGERRTVEGLLKLKEAFEKVDIPERKLSDTLLIATWNIREFDSTKYSVRGREPIFYIAEIINRFDLVAVQEVRDDLTAPNELTNYLGGWWKCVLTDATEGTQGNREHMAFLYDSRKIRFGGLAGEIVVPTTKKHEPAKQLARTPFVVGLQAGWFKFTICTTHILYGKAKAEDPNRLEEIRVLAEFLADRAREVCMVEEHDSPGRFQHLRHQRSDLGGDHRRGFYSAEAVTEATLHRPTNQALRSNRFYRS